MLYTMFLSCASLLASTTPFNIYDLQGNPVSSLTTDTITMGTTTPAINWETVTYKSAPQNVWAAYQFEGKYSLLNLAKFSKKIGQNTVQGYSIKSLIETNIKNDIPTLSLAKNVLTLESTLAKQTIPVSAANTFSFTPLTILSNTSISLGKILSNYTGPYPTSITFSTILNSGTVNPSGSLACDTPYTLATQFPVSYTALSGDTSQNLTVYFNKNQKQSGIITLEQPAG